MIETPTSTDNNELIEEATDAIARLESSAQLGCGNFNERVEDAFYALELIPPEVRCQVLIDRFSAAVQAVIRTTVNSRTKYCEYLGVSNHQVPEKQLAWANMAVASDQMAA